MENAISSVALVGAVLGIASHLGFFIKGEHHVQSPRIGAAFILAPILLFVSIQRHIESDSNLEAGKITAVATGSYFGALCLSILAYRAFFHPLRNFPGPTSMKLTKWAHTLKIGKESRNFMLVDELLNQYGDFVRVGPNDLVTRVPEAVAAISGPGSACRKAEWYEDVVHPNISLHLTRDRVAHDKRRKVWDRGFSVKALKEYEPRVKGFSEELISQLYRNSGKRINCSKWFNFYSIDIMGDMAFGKSFDTLKTGEQHVVIKLLQQGIEPLGILTPVPWTLLILKAIPGLATGPKQFIKYNSEKVAARKKEIPDSPDLFGWLIDAEKQSPDPIHKDPRWLQGDCGLIIVAGSDTTAATLTHIFYHLCQSPKIFAELREELDGFYKSGSETEFKDLQDAKYLNGIINETLRLHPPVPGGLLRQTPNEGITIGSTFIPGNVTISTPFWSLGRLESCYKNAEEFIPERWGDRPELVKDKSVFVPFSSGAYGCVGKQFALMQLRNVTARMVTEFDVKFAPGEDGSRLIKKSKDTFTMCLAPMELIFTKREN